MTRPETKILDTMIWSPGIKERDDYTCRNCGKTKEDSALNSHHIISRVIQSTRWKFKNGICLCIRCHSFDAEAVHNDPPTWTQKFTEMNIPYKELKLESKQLFNKTYFEVLQDMLLEAQELGLLKTIETIQEYFNKPAPKKRKKK